MFQIARFCVQGLVGGATVCASAPAWATVATIAIVASASIVISKGDNDES